MQNFKHFQKNTIDNSKFYTYNIVSLIIRRNVMFRDDNDREFVKGMDNPNTIDQKLRYALTIFNSDGCEFDPVAIKVFGQNTIFAKYFLYDGMRTGLIFDGQGTLLKANVDNAYLDDARVVSVIDSPYSKVDPKSTPDKKVMNVTRDYSFMYADSNEPIASSIIDDSEKHTIVPFAKAPDKIDYFIKHAKSIEDESILKTFYTVVESIIASIEKLTSQNLDKLKEKANKAYNDGIANITATKYCKDAARKNKLFE